MASSARWLVAGLLFVLVAAEPTVADRRTSRLRGWSALWDGPAALDITNKGELLPRFRPPGYGQPRQWCPVGWQWNGRRCVDVDECRQRNECRSNVVTCMNTLGSYRCMCLPGLTGDYYTVGCKTAEEYCETKFRDAASP